MGYKFEATDRRSTAPPTRSGRLLAPATGRPSSDGSEQIPAVPNQYFHSRRGTRFQPFRSRGECAIFPVLDIDNGTVASELQVHRSRRLAPHLDFFMNYAERLPFILVLVFVLVGRIQFIHVQVLLIDTEIRSTKGNPIIVSIGDARDCRFAN